MARVVREYEPGELKIALAGWVIHAGFESPATDYEENRISLDAYVSNYPNAVIYIKVTGNCMQYSGIEEGDLLIVDRSLSPQSGDVIIGVLNNGLVLLNVSPFWQQVVKGGVILLAVIIDKSNSKSE